MITVGVKYLANELDIQLFSDHIYLNYVDSITKKLILLNQNRI